VLTTPPNLKVTLLDRFAAIDTNFDNSLVKRDVYEDPDFRPLPINGKLFKFRAWGNDNPGCLPSYNLTLVATYADGTTGTFNTQGGLNPIEIDLDIPNELPVSLTATYEEDPEFVANIVFKSNPYVFATGSSPRSKLFLAVVTSIVYTDIYW
jgi:hypothetical protein